MSTKRKTVIFYVLLFLFLMIGVWFLFRKTNSDKFHYNYDIEDEKLGLVLDVSQKSVSEVKYNLQKEINELNLELMREGEKIDSVSLKELNVEANIEDVVNEAIQKNNQFWGFDKYTHQVIDVNLLLSVNENDIREKLSELNCIKNYEIPQDAFLSKQDNEMVIVPEVRGTLINQDLLVAVIKEKIEHNVLYIDLDSIEDLYVKPDILEDNAELVRQRDLYNKVVNLKVEYLFGSRKEKVPKETIAGWLELENGELKFDEEAMLAYIEELAHTYNTFRTTRKFTTTNGQVINVPAGDYGWSISQTKEVARLVEELQLGENISREPTWLYQGYGDYVYGDGSDIGNTYVEISIPDQTLWLYVDGELILSSEFVSGTESNGNYTPSGVFGLTYKTKNATLRGRGYASHVNYWMPFNGNIGMHDATWRNRFGGNIYKTSGSHGCINLPLENAKTIYGYVETYFPVIVYRQTELDNGSL